MKLTLFSRIRRHDSIAALYGAIVAQARHSTFYRCYGVPDTPTGRFEMIVLHLAAVLDRLTRESEACRRAGQETFDIFCRDMDDHLREMGVGDLAVPKKIRRLAEVFYSRHAAYRRALREDDGQALADLLARNVFADRQGGDARRLAAYLRQVVEGLAAQGGEGIVAAQLVWPDPGTIFVSARLARE